MNDFRHKGHLTSNGLFSTKAILWCLCIISIIAVLFRNIALHGDTFITNMDTSISGKEVCRNSHNIVALYNLKTKLGVSYDGGHWFHMAENFLTEHSLLRESNRQSNASTIMLNFDNGKHKHISNISHLI